MTLSETSTGRPRAFYDVMVVILSLVWSLVVAGFEHCLAWFGRLV
jgi:formate/nitrite transporter FocA (FNT family)